MSPSAIKSNGHKGIPPLERQRVVSPNDPGLMARVWHQKWHLFGTRTRLPRCTFSARASGEEKAGRSSEGSREHPAARTFDGLVEQVWGAHQRIAGKVRTCPGFGRVLGIAATCRSSLSSHETRLTKSRRIASKRSGRSMNTASAD